MTGDQPSIAVKMTQTVAVIDIVGDLTVLSDAALRAAYQQTRETDAMKLLMQFRWHDDMDSAGIAVLIDIVIDAYQQGCRIAVCGLSADFQKIFRMVGLAQYLEIYADTATAFAQLADDR